MFSKPINWWFIGFLGVLIASLWITHLARVKHAVEVTTHTVTTRLNTEYQKKLDKAVADAIAATKLMQSDADKIKEDKYAKIEANNVQLSADYKRLQLRANRPSPEKLPNTPLGGETCTARELYREDAEFLTGEAARAESVLIERDYYYERYESARKRIDEFANSK